MGDKFKRRFTLTFFAVILLIVGFFGGQYYLSRTYEQQLEMGYRRAFNELAYHLQEITLEMDRARLAISDQQKQNIEGNVKRLVYAAQSNMGELPHGELQLDRVAHLLDEIQNPNPAEAERLYNQIQHVSDELQKLLLCKEREFPWVSWRDYLRASPIIPTFLQGLVAINAGIDDFKKPVRSGEITGEEITEKEARQIAQNFSGIQLDFQVVNESEGAIPTYTLEAEAPKESILLEVSKRGGAVLWMVSTKQVHESKLSVTELAKLGEEFLEARNFPALHLTDVQSLEHRTIFTFVPKRQNVLYYGEPLKVQLSAFDGSVVGFWGTPFYLAQSRAKGEIQTADLDVAWIPEEKVRQGVEILDQKFALIKNDQRDVLVRRLGVQYEGNYYLIYLHAQTGEEERIEQVSSSQFF